MSIHRTTKRCGNCNLNCYEHSKVTRRGHKSQWICPLSSKNFILK